MEALALYLLKSAAWLAGFCFVYLVFLRNESFFTLNRMFLFSGLLSSLFLPFFTFTYTVIIQDPLTAAVRQAGPVTALPIPGEPSGFNIGLLLAVIYGSGVLFAVFASARQGTTIIRQIRKSGSLSSDPVRVIRSGEYESAFSFFSWVFINPSISETEMREIMNHELVHVRHRHSIDLLLADLLCIIQWFNPMSWYFTRLIRQNHEYIADRIALQRSSDPAIYRAALLNQLVGAPVITLGNSFNYSLNRKRFKMMEKIISPPYRKLKLLFILPVFAVVFYAFSRPDYRYAAQPGVQSPLQDGQQQKGLTVNGKIVTKNGEPLPGANIVVVNTTTGTTSDEKGNFTLTGIVPDAALAISFVGYKSKVIKQEFVQGTPIVMEKDTIRYRGGPVVLPPPPPPPPPPSGKKVIRGEAKLPVVTGYGSDGGTVPPPPPPPPPSGKAAGEGITIKGSTQPLIIVDGVERTTDIDEIDPETIDRISVLKDKYATDKYGEKGKDGVVEIFTKSKENVYVVVEELPQFPGGNPGIQAYLRDNIKIPAGFEKSKFSGLVEVLLIVDKQGKTGSASMVRSIDPELDREIINAINRMPGWKPGVQNGKAVDTQIIIPVELR